jgi:hypothetical protein
MERLLVDWAAVRTLGAPQPLTILIRLGSLARPDPAPDRQVILSDQQRLI